MLLNPDIELTTLQKTIIEQLRTVFDPEIPVNVFDLGLIYDVQVDNNSEVTVTMTLTAPNCPSVDDMVNEINIKVAELEDVRKTKVDITFDPPWDHNRMSEEARLVLGWM